MIVERGRSIDNMKDDEELEMLLGEIPHATSLTHHHHHLSHTSGNHHHHNYHHHVVNGNGHGFGSTVTPHSMNRSSGILMYGGVYDDDPSCSYKQNTCISPASAFSLQSNGSSSSLFSNGHSPLSDKGSPTPPPLDDSNPKPHMLIRNSHFPCENLPDSKLPNSSFGKKVGENLVDELNLSCNLSRMYISEEQEEVLVRDCGVVPNRFNYARVGASDDYSKPFSDYTVVQSPVPRSSVGFSGEISPALFGFQQNCGLLGMQISPGQAENLFPRSDFNNSLLNSQCRASRELAGYNCYKREVPASNLAAPNVLYSTRENGMNILEERGIGALPNLQNLPQLSQPRLNANIDYEHHQLPHISNGRAASATSNRTPHGGFVTLAASEDSLIIQGEGVSHGRNRGFGGLRGQNRKCSLHEKRSQLETTRSQLVGACENGRSAKVHWSFSSPIRCNSLAEAQGYIFMIAKDQHGCRFLQKIFDEGSPQDVKIVFDEIIGHVVELMINPFGNYLMQKLLEVCNEEQRMHILMAVTNEPMELVRISLNTHGTRVVQKLIETLKTRQQIKLVISALEPGFLSLIKDLNGNHVIQRCLQCLSNEDNKFIFEAAAEYCVDIATHQHGCCVLQRCINHSTGEHRESLVAEISANGLHLAQDSFGNYVVQYILELQIPSAVSKLISQFEGNYVHLSRQKFSSHVVEKCLLALDSQVRSMIIRELLSATHFEQLLQDPHANYVVQTALRVAEGALHNSLVSVIESHKAISRNSPYSKRIFSHKLLKK